MVLIKGMTPQEIRVLQEFRRVGAESLPLETIKAIRHPTGGSDALAASLVSKGFLASDASTAAFSLTETGKEFLAIDYKPEVESPGGDEVEE